MPRYSGLLLDAGNTLFREVPSRAEIYARTARSFGLEVDTETAGRLKQCGPGSAGEGFAELEGAALCGEWLQRWVDAGRP